MGSWGRDSNHLDELEFDSQEDKKFISSLKQRAGLVQLPIKSISLVFPGLNQPELESGQSTPFGTDVFRTVIAVLVPWYVIMAWTGIKDFDTEVFEPGVGGRGQGQGTGNSWLRNVCLSVPLSARMEKLVCDRTDFREV